jgi:hypothetical protein
VSFFRYLRTTVIALSLALLLFTTTACNPAIQADRPAALPGSESVGGYSQLERGNTATGQNFGDWVVKTASGLVQDAYVRGDNKLGVVISPQVRPTEVRSLAKSLTQGFHKNFPDRNLTVLMYAPDKKLIMTAKYNDSTHKIEYQAAS